MNLFFTRESTVCEISQCVISLLHPLHITDPSIVCMMPPPAPSLSPLAEAAAQGDLETVTEQLLLVEGTQIDAHAYGLWPMHHYVLR